MITMRVVALLVPALIAGVASVAVPPPQTTAELSSSTVSPTTPLQDGCLSSMVGDSADTRARRCQRKRTKLIRKYYSHLGKNRWRKIHICRQLRRLRHCEPARGSTCPVITPELRHWQTLVDFLNCNCSVDEAECYEDRRCFEDESSSPLMHACADIYDFNLKQKTQSRCFFLAEKLRCQQAVLASACDRQAALALYDVVSLVEASTHCQLTSGSTHNQGFRYSAECQPEFADHMAACETDHIEERQILFFDTFELVVVGNATELHRSCRNFEAYASCVSGLKRDCPEGTRIVYDSNDRLRTYVAKMEYICGEVNSAYVGVLGCLHEKHNDRSVLLCGMSWSQVSAALRHNVTAHEYFCRPDSHATRTVVRRLRHVQQCYSAAFTSLCGRSAGAIVTESIKRAFADPYYLNLRRRPDCDLHAGRIPDRSAMRRPTARTVSVNASSKGMKSTRSRPAAALLGALLCASALYTSRRA